MVRHRSSPVLVHPACSQHIWRWDFVGVDTGHCDFSVIFDDRLETREEVFRDRVRPLMDLVNRGSAT